MKQVTIELVEIKKSLLSLIEHYTELANDVKESIVKTENEIIPENIEIFHQKMFGIGVKDKHLYFLKEQLREYENQINLYQEELKNLKPLTFLV